VRTIRDGIKGSDGNFSGKMAALANYRIDLNQGTCLETGLDLSGLNHASASHA
jgi:hypothetical protein